MSRWSSCLFLLAAALWFGLALQPPQPGIAQGAPVIPESYALAAENDTLRLYVDPATLAFKVLDQRSGYVWHSGIDAPQDDDRLNRSWRAFAQSGLSIEIYDAKAVSERVSIANAETDITVTPIENGISALVTFTEYGITVGLNLQLEDDGLRVELPFSAIQEANPDYRLGQITPYPFMGATRGSQTPGYMLLPDGTGSIIEFADSTRAQNMFYGRYYGPDLGIIVEQPFNPDVYSPYPITYPVFGMVHGEGENAYLTVIEQGAAYGELQAHPAGIITNFNFLYNTFIYNESYFQATNRSGAGVTVVQPQPTAFDVVQHYRFLTGPDASIVGMAQDYQHYLLDRGQLQQADFSNPEMGIRLEFLGGDKEPALFWTNFVPMTTIPQMRDILDALDLPNAEVVYYGWQPSGATSMPPTALAVDGALGSVDDLRALADDIAAAGGHLSLYLNPQAALYNQPGYTARTDLAMAITDKELLGYNRFPTHYFTSSVLDQRFGALANSVDESHAVGLALDGIGWTLYSDFRDGQRVSREAALDSYQALLGQSPLRLGFYMPNDYFYRFAQAYFDMPTGDNNYIFTTRAVPFLPIALAGYLPYYGPAFNFSSNRQLDLLRHVEYGIYPSYFVTAEPTALMLNTPSAWIYSSSYAQWGDQIRSTYAWMNALLGPVRGQEIVGHGELAEGVIATTYADGQRIIVNYTDQPYSAGGITVPPMDAVLGEAQP